MVVPGIWSESRPPRQNTPVNFMTEADKALSKAAAVLARAAPESWSRLITGLELHTQERIMSLVNSPDENLHLFQGHAREAAYLLKTFVNCIATAEALKGK